MFFFPQLRGVPGISSGSVDVFFFRNSEVCHICICICICIFISVTASQGGRAYARARMAGITTNVANNINRPVATPPRRADPKW